MVGDEKRADEKKIKTIREGIGLNDQHPQFKALVKYQEIVEEKTEGEIKVETYHSGQLGNDRSITEALQIGPQ